MADPARVRRILAALDEEPAQTHEGLVASTGLSSRHLARLLWALEEEGLVIHEGRRWYRSPEARPKRIGRR